MELSVPSFPATVIRTNLPRSQHDTAIKSVKINRLSAFAATEGNRKTVLFESLALIVMMHLYINKFQSHVVQTDGSFYQLPFVVSHRSVYTIVLLNCIGLEEMQIQKHQNT